MDKHPLKTQATTAFTFAALGNLLSQLIVEKRPLDDIDYKSTAKFSAIALCISFPIIRTWLGVLERIVRPGRFAAVKKMLIDQSSFGPVFLAFFIVLMGFVEGTGWEDAKLRLRRDYVDVLMNNYKLWPAANLINFYLVPFNHRILFGACVGLFWNIYLATISRKGTGIPIEELPLME